MGNTSTKEQWAGRERLAFIERNAWWRGAVNRGDLRDVFGISTAQASADLQGYQEMNPGALNYNLSSKRYEAAADMRCVLHEPRLEDAVRGILGEWAPIPAPVNSGALVSVFVPPERKAAPEVERRVFVAIRNGRKLRIKYHSMHRGTTSWREIAPHALGHDGYRWHVRAWCFENEDFRDFALSRIENADWPGEHFVAPKNDAEWNEWETITLRAHHELDENRKQAIEYDYGMINGKLTIKVRKAMVLYVMRHLRIETDKEFSVHLELATGK